MILHTLNAVRSFALLLAMLPMTVWAQDTSNDETTTDDSNTTVEPPTPIVIKGNVYGGGNAGNLGGKTTVTVNAGDIEGGVFGGARQANVGGRTFVHINGQEMSDNIIINAVYGGNDIAGTIGTSPDAVPEGVDRDKHHTDELTTNNAFILTEPERTETKSTTGNNNTTTTTTTAPFHIFIGQLFGGGYGDYTYTAQKDGNNNVIKDKEGNILYDVTVDGKAITGIRKPELNSTYVDIHGGTFGYIYGGGNAVTVKEYVNICINNESIERTKSIDKDGNPEGEDDEFMVSKQRLKDMGININYFNKTPNHNTALDGFLMSRVFGGNNKAEMHITPTWHLQNGSIENLYSGGNEGAMTAPNGLLLEIGKATETSQINVYNVYGGCRKADVRPEDDNGKPVSHVYNIEGYNFPTDFAARVVLHSGNVHNVYGGNDVRGRVYFGNAVGIRCSISGDVYGGGNGSYPYTDNDKLENDPVYGDFYYNPITELGLNPETVTTFTQAQSVEALNKIRPNAEQVSLRIMSTDETHPTIIGGSVYCGGNSATLSKDPAKVNNAAYPGYPKVELKIGSHIKLNEVFLGNNGANMVANKKTDDVLRVMNSTIQPSGTKFNSIDLTDKALFAEYMNGCAMNIIPSVVFDNEKLGDGATYKDYTAFIGSFYCGGNVGSMIYTGVKPINFDEKLIIFDKLVGGCNNAYVPVQYVDEDKTQQLNAAFEGGIIGGTDDTNETTGNKVELRLANVKIQPMRWVVERNDEDGEEYNTKKTDANGNYIYVLDANGNRQLEWNIVDSEDNIEVNPVRISGTGPASHKDLVRRFAGGNVYGGCYSSGIVKGNVVINLDSTLVEREKLFDDVECDEFGEEVSLYGTDQTKPVTFNITKRNTGVILAQQGMDVLGKALNVFGGGKGKSTEIWGSTTVNLNSGYVFQIFGGSQEGVIGKREEDSTGEIIASDKADGTYDSNGIYHFNDKTYKANDEYSCYVNLKGKNAGVSKKADQSPQMAECEFMYGGGFEGPILGNAIINLGKGRVFNSFTGSCNADILGHAETYIGRMISDAYQDKMGYLGKTKDNENIRLVEKDDYYEEGFPWVRDITYGGNDLGGIIYGEKSFKDRVREGALGMVHPIDISTDTDTEPDVLTANAYTEYLQGRADGIFGGCYGTYDYTDTRFAGITRPHMTNAFVNFRPYYTQVNNMVGKVYGAGQGYPGDTEHDKMQDRSYVLVDVPQDMEYYKSTEVFGAGAWGGLGMKTFIAPNGNPTNDEEAALDAHSAVIDLVRGQISAAYGGSFTEGVTRRTVVNVPEGSTIEIDNIFAGAYGADYLHPCDVYEGIVNYNSDLATVTGAIFGGNNSERRTLYGKVNVNSTVWSHKDRTKKYYGTVFGAGKGSNTWNEYTEVNLNPGALVYEVYGGGKAGKVYNAESIQQYMNFFATKTTENGNTEIPASAWTLGSALDETTTTQKSYYVPTMESGKYSDYVGNETNNLTNLQNPLVTPAEMDDRDYTNPLNKAINKNRYNTNVLIKQGATVTNYAYGGGLGEYAKVAGTTYIALLGGTVKKDIYAAGTSGAVQDTVGTHQFIASANAYIRGGSVRNVYGGGWNGSVGMHEGVPTTKIDNNGNIVPAIDVIGGDIDEDIYGETHVVIGIPDDELTANPLTENDDNYDPDYYFHNGIPAIQRNAYGGGEGGPIYGCTHINMMNGYIGYEYKGLKDEKQPVIALNGTETGDSITIKVPFYEEKIVDETNVDKDGHFIENKNLEDSGCLFGGGYVDNSCVDSTMVKMYGGIVRNALFGGGEIAAVGRGKIAASGENNFIRSLEEIYKPGKTLIEMFGGHVRRNVFGGGRGYNNLGKQGTLFSDGFIFGQTETNIYGGEIGTDAGVANGDGNVFGGGDIGYVYSAYEYDDGNGHKLPRKGVKGGTRYDGLYEGYYYEHAWADNEKFILYKNGVECSTCEETDENVERKLTEDCKVLIEPRAKVFYQYEEPVIGTDGKPVYEYGKMKTITHDVTTVSINGHDWKPGEYVTIDDLNTLKNKNNDKERWQQLDSLGIIIHNAVFAGGNTSSGSATVYANTTSVFGNATASIHDIYHRDLITMGTGHTGGLYGDGNLTFVDGYRGLNITNYGTDYYSISKEVTIDEYHSLSAREAAYYELKYKCLHTCEDKEQTSYSPDRTENGKVIKASTITADELLTLFLIYNSTTNKYSSVVYEGQPVLQQDNNGKWIPNPYFWEENGVLPVYAGRLMNSIQRADFCGVFGSRMVMQGAQDRVPEEVDYTNYTINRVREVSLNKKLSAISSDTGEAAKHGNYFGIYNIVNYLGALTSDVDFGGESNTNNYGAIRVTDNENTETYGPDLDPARTSISFVENLDNAKKAEILEKAEAIDGVTVNGNTITASTVKALYQLRSITGLKFSDTPLTNQTYYDWKALHHEERKRNNGNSHNKVALASGVYLELTTEKSTGKNLDEKDWGLITGVVELDLINVQTGIGGGFVYARNEHGKRRKTGHMNTTLTKLNKDAVTRWDYEYDVTEGSGENKVNVQKEWQTSGNFVHSTQTIIDDCYNISGKYEIGDGKTPVPAHYWYIKGSVYVYDQYISAYTGAPNAYSETVDIPLTITAASHGSMKLLDIMPNKYAYFNANGNKLGDEQKLIIQDVTYHLNDPISYWDWYKLSSSEQALFVDKTYVTTQKCQTKDNGTDKILPAGYVMLPDEYTSLRNYAQSQTIDKKYVKAVENIITDEDGVDQVEKDKDGHIVYKPFDYVFRESNNLSHTTGYILTYKVNNPTEWNDWYTEKKDFKEGDTKAREKNQTGGDDYWRGPTYHLISNNGEVLGQRDYEVGDIISHEVETTYQTITNKPSDQATFDEAYIVTQQVTTTESYVDDDNQTKTKTVHYNEGATVSEYQATNNADFSGKVERAYVCTSTIQLSNTEYIYLDTKMTASKKSKYISDVETDIRKIVPNTKLTDARLEAIKKYDDLKADELSGLSSEQKQELASLIALRQDMRDNIQLAYYCTEPGLYGGRDYASGYNYRGLEAWSSMSAKDREKFAFNYDALDLLIDTCYSHTKNNPRFEGLKYSEGKKYQYDSAEGTLTAAQNNPAGYSLEQPVDYTAEYNSTTALNLGTGQSVNVIGKNGAQTSITKGDELTRTEYEKLTNEQRNYSTIKTDDNGIVYVVHTAFQVGNTPYAVGETIHADEYIGNEANVTKLEFGSTHGGETYYYCRESYKVGENGNGTSVTNSGGTAGYDNEGNAVTIKTTAYNNNDVVPIGVVIDGNTYTTLANKNQQKDFSIHGIAPTETSTLFVSRESDIFDLSTEKIITVIYKYDYEECDTKGNITPVSERHVVNIHITFKSGIPSVEDIKAPQIIIPGDYVGLREPNVKPGAYEVTGGGWELFEDIDDAERHINGIEFAPVYDPLYWYQDGYYVAYYAKTYLGKSYSNHVPVSVANYHDLKKVVEAKKHHYYVDNPDVKRDSKIYIEDYSGDETGSTNGLDLLKDLFDLSVLNYNKETDLDDDGLLKSGDFEGHKPLNSRVTGGQNLDFFLRTDIDHGPTTTVNEGQTITENHPWTPIGLGTHCFEGTLHGDGHHISGLQPAENTTGSLFSSLCGEVYNLGVSGSFTGGGIADSGEGYAENCWVKTTGTPATGTKAIIGTLATTTYDQVVNSYYPETNAFTAGPATPMPEKAFYNGEVAYNLNGFYLNKRYYDGTKLGSGKGYYYLQPNADGTLPDELSTAYYPTNYAIYPLNEFAPMERGYVEERFFDGDFRYANGKIPETTEERMKIVKEKDSEGKDVDVTYYAPIWPDDYLFFGQTLSYGHVANRTHQDVPSSINRSDGRVLATTSGNRVYRAPAYFRSGKMSVAHFNPDAVFAQTKKDNADVLAYKDMTAIDFTGYDDYNDKSFEKAWATHLASTSAQDAMSAQKDHWTQDNEGKFFFPPLLDVSEGLYGFHNADLTRNLLVYTEAAGGTGADQTPTATQKTANVVSAYLTDQAYSETNDIYHTVDAWDSYADVMRGHWVQKMDGKYTATLDHMLIDRQDFNAPISYTFKSGKRMWHQREPETFVDRSKGWQAISLPFTADIVTTNQKGEITHFYSGSSESKNNTHTKIGHEYWLREFTDVKEETKVVDNENVTVATADFLYPTATNSHSDDKTVTNTFLWDYYYEAANGHKQKDHNADTYQEYYSDERKYDFYPRLANGTPYLIGFPGVTYYEFDLSGQFVAGTTAEPTPDKIGTQTITFASADTGITIGISDEELNGVTQSYKGMNYTFMPSYLNDTLHAVKVDADGKRISGDKTPKSFFLKSDGSAYDAVTRPADSAEGTNDVVVAAFRPFFIETATSSARQTRSILFGYSNGEEQDPHGTLDNVAENGTLSARAGRRTITVSSALKTSATVRIVNTAGQAIATFDIQPGESIDTHVNIAGVYIIQSSDGHYTKKLAVR